jgi:hypothetical protein
LAFFGLLASVGAGSDRGGNAARLRRSCVRARDL